MSNIDRCARVKDSGHNIEWQHSMVTENPEGDVPSSNVSTVVSAVISTLLVLILLGVASGYVYIYGRNHPGSWAEKLALRLEAPYKRFGLIEENEEQNNNNNNNAVEMGQQKVTENNNTDSTISF